MEDHRRLTVVLVRAKVDGRHRTGVKQKRGVLSSEPLNCTSARDGAIDLLAPFHPSPPWHLAWIDSELLPQYQMQISQVFPSAGVNLAHEAP